MPVDNSLVMFNALRAQRVPTELHLFAEGKHGFGIRGARGLPAAEWPQLAMNWIASLPRVKSSPFLTTPRRGRCRNPGPVCRAIFRP